MSKKQILSFQNASISFADTTVFEDFNLIIHEGRKISLVGKNGSGKTTLFRMITAEQELHSGTRWVEPHLTIGHMQQTIDPQNYTSIHHFMTEYLPKNSHNDPEPIDHRIDALLSPLGLSQERDISTLSGGELRRLTLARALLESPDLLLLDEPTNHLDIDSIDWLEQTIKAFKGTVICISHDRRFLSNITNTIFWLDRGQVKTTNQGFAQFEKWSTDLLEQERRELENRQKQVDLESEWASRGVKARRKRNIRRLEQFKQEREQLKKDKSLYNKTLSTVKLSPLTPDQTSKCVAEFIKVSFTHTSQKENNTTENIPIVKDFNLRIMAGDRIGILGKNGSGKTSFIKLLTGEMSIHNGKVKRAKSLDIAYFDQNRETLTPQLSLWRTLAPHGDFVSVGGKPRHVVGYLKDFLFDPKQAQAQVSTLSGGQKNRLMLAKILANPGGLLILDEPTNDLDMDTLDLLTDILMAYEGTLVIVSHDRDFLDNTTHKLLIFEGNGKIETLIGNYDDYLRIKQNASAPAQTQNVKKTKATEQKNPTPEQNTPKTQKLTYKLQYELDQLPAKIAHLEQQITALEHEISNPDLFSSNPKRFHELTTRIPALKTDLEQAEERWLELETLKQTME